MTTSANFGSSFVTAAGSGPAFGFIGASCALLALHAKRLRNHLISWALILVTLAVNAFIGATPFVDNLGNTAGFVVGAMLGAGMIGLRLVRYRFVYLRNTPKGQRFPTNTKALELKKALT